MSDTPEKKSNIVALNTIPPHQNLVKANRWLLAAVFFLMAVIVVGGWLLIPREDLTAYKQTTDTQLYMDHMNPVLSAEVNALKGQFVGLVSGSIESKLRTLEESVRLGAAPDSLMTIEELRSDIKTLRAYSATQNNSKSTLPNEQLMEEMSALKKLVYLSLASCGLMLAAVAGVWINNRRRLSYKEMITRYLHKQ
ncbi:MAG: hypothetical protein Q8N30_00270 [Methylococcales bacterium]|jgi:hypothetical protein|nr:hypothetical protein [Methylococcales bacterium]